MIFGLALAGGVPTATASQGDSPKKVFVCKYVGQPNVDERLQTGDNPINVSVSSITPFPGVGHYFADAHGQSFVLAWADKDKPEPPRTNCPAPRGPDPVVTSQDKTTCTVHSVRTITTPFVLKDRQWVAGEPVYGAWVNSTPTAEQLEAAGLDCRPAQPVAEVVVMPEDATSCTEYSVRDVTVTMPYVWNARTHVWELGDAGEPVYGAWVNSTPTAAQLEAAGLDCAPEQPVQPDPIVTTSAVSGTTCAAFTTTTTTTTTSYVSTDGKWVLGAPVVTTGEPVVSTPTAAQIKAAGLVCTAPVPPVSVLGVSAAAPPKAAKPAEASVSVLGVSATANPLPTAAQAGDADTSGQLAAGGLTGLAALLAFGAAFMSRRRRGVV